MRWGWLTLVFLGLSCQQDELPLAVKKSADMHVPQLYDPYKLPSILGEKNAYKGEKSGTESIVPKVDLDLNHEQIGYYQIQRCPAGAKLETAAGVDPLTHNYSSGMQDLKERNYLYVWGKAAAGACTLLGELHVEDPFVDYFHTEGIGGADGFNNFFYLVRPCLKADKSIYGGQRTCSYAFARTETIRGYVNNIAIGKQAHMSDLAEQRSRLEFLMMQMAGVIKEKAAYLQKCETNWINKQVVMRRLAGIAKVALTSTAIVAGAVLSGGTAAFLAGTAAIQLSDKLFSGISNADVNDNCPTDDYDDRNKGIEVDVDETIAKIGEIRSSLGELELANPPGPAPLPELEEEIAAAGASP